MLRFISNRMLTIGSICIGNLITLVVLATTLAIPAAANATVFKCKDASGGYAYQGTPCSGKASPVSSWQEPSFHGVAPAPSLDTLSLQQSSDGAYRVDGSANGTALTFIVDTGANVMALSKDIATSAGLQCESNRTATTANGTAAGCETTVSNLTIGSITVHNVKAIIMPNMMQEALLGMNVLGKFKVEHENGTMKLSSAPSR